MGHPVNVHIKHHSPICHFVIVFGYVIILSIVLTEMWGNFRPIQDAKLDAKESVMILFVRGRLATLSKCTHSRGFRKLDSEFLKESVASQKNLKGEFVVNILHRILCVSAHPFQQDIKKRNATVGTDIAVGAFFRSG